jgi:hypothetical protein
MCAFGVHETCVASFPIQRKPRRPEMVALTIASFADSVSPFWGMAMNAREAENGSKSLRNAHPFNAIRALTQAKGFRLRTRQS